MAVSARDRKIVRDLAKRVAEVAANPIQKKKLAEWKRHNSLKPGKPMVQQQPEGVWNEFIPLSSLECLDDLCHKLERSLRMRLYSVEHFCDDRPVTAEFACDLHIHDSGWGIKVNSERNPEFQGVHGAEYYKMVLEDDADVEKLISLRQITVNRESSLREYEQVAGLIGDILTVRMKGCTWFVISPMDILVTWRGIEKGLLDLVDRPEWVHRALNRITDSEIDVAKQLEALNALSLNNNSDDPGGGGTLATDELPAANFNGKHVRLKDMWGAATTQIFSEVSPAMHDEFAISYEARFLSLFGLNFYGCCEPLHRKIDLVRKLPRVRRVSMSRWVNPEFGAEQIGRDFIFSYKSNPAYLASETWDIELCRKEMVRVLEATKKNGCVVEFIMKDTHTCRGEPQRYDEWTDMAMCLAEEYA